MAAKTKVPQATIRRLSFYLRCLNSLEEKGVTLISSHELAKLLHINPAQVRKDLAYFGEFGKRGVGYTIIKLRDHLIKILGLKKQRLVGIVGAGGRLGHALALYKGFERRNFKVVALFDKDPQVIGQKFDHHEVVHIDKLPKLVKDLKIEILIFTVPVEAVQEIYEMVQTTDVRAVLNFAPTKLGSTTQICIHNVDVAIELESLSYHLNNLDLDNTPGLFEPEMLAE